MKSFEVGDEVKIINKPRANTPFVGQTGTVTKIYCGKDGVIPVQYKVHIPTRDGHFDYFPGELEYNKFFRTEDFEVC